MYHCLLHERTGGSSDVFMLLGADILKGQAKALIEEYEVISTDIIDTLLSLYVQCCASFVNERDRWDSLV